MTCVFVPIGQCRSIGFRIPPPRHLIVHSQTRLDLSFPHKMLALTLSGAWTEKTIAYVGHFCEGFDGLIRIVWTFDMPLLS